MVHVYAAVLQCVGVEYYINGQYPKNMYEGEYREHVIDTNRDGSYAFKFYPTNY